MRNFILTILFTFLTTHYSISFAENWVCYDMATNIIQRAQQGDGMKLGITGLNNSNIKEGCFIATPDEFEKAKKNHVRADMTKRPKVYDLSQEEIDRIEAQQLKEANAIKAALVDQGKDVSMEDLIQALIDIGAVDGDTLKTKIKQNRGLIP